MKRWWYKRIAIILSLTCCLMMTGFGINRIEDNDDRRRVDGDNVRYDMLIPGGMPIGIYMETDGVLVLTTEAIKSSDGREYEPAKNIVKAGDYIVAINGKEINSKKDLIREVNNMKNANVVLGLRRDNTYIDVKFKAVEENRTSFKLGIWVKDNIQGLGTITYIDVNGDFGALGHGIHDSETEELLEIEEGVVYETNIVGIQKGKKGKPGGLEGVIIYNDFNEIGIIEDNTENGIFGHVDELDAVVKSQEALKICDKEDVKLGKATIRCTIDEQVVEYDIKIKNIDSYAKDANKEIIIEVTDKDLISKTGGIVQGMSGSPIIQNGKIVGAVTHVLVNDPTRGYGIFIEDMITSAK